MIAMTYKSYLEDLLDSAIGKAELYFHVGEGSSDKCIPLDGANAGRLKLLHDDWQRARNDYYTFLQYIADHQINVDDEMPD